LDWKPYKNRSSDYNGEEPSAIRLERRMTDGPTNEERKVVKNELAALLKISKTGGHATQGKKKPMSPSR